MTVLLTLQRRRRDGPLNGPHAHVRALPPARSLRSLPAAVPNKRSFGNRRQMRPRVWLHAGPGPASVPLEAPEQCCLRLQQWALQVSLVIWFTMVMRDRTRPPLWAQLPHILQTAANQRQHVLQTGPIGHRPFSAAGNIDG